VANRIGVQLERDAEQLVPYMRLDLPILLPIGRWWEIEVSPGVFVCPDEIATQIRAIDAPVYIGVKGSPTWMRVYPPALCSAPLPEYYPNLAKFCLWLCTTFPNIAGLEIGNEPEVAPQDAMGVDYYLGGWGMDKGAEYAKAVNKVYDKLQKYVPNVKVIAGALIGKWPFLQAALAAGLKCHAISFHSYVREGRSYDDVTQRAATIKALGTTQPIWCTETAMRDPTYAGGTLYESQKADYFEYLINSAHGVAKIFWYGLGRNTWQRTSLLGPGDVETPAYGKYKGQAS